MAKSFLPSVSLKRLRDLEKNENDPKAKTMLLACIARKEGKKIVEIAGMLNKPYKMVQGWLTRISKGGLKRRHDIKNRGADCKMGGAQIRRLMKALDAGPAAAGYETNLWTMRLVHAYIKSEFGVEYHPDSIWQLLHRLEYRPIRPRPVNPKSATPEEIAAFKKSSEDGTLFPNSSPTCRPSPGRAASWASCRHDVTPPASRAIDSSLHLLYRATLSLTSCTMFSHLRAIRCSPNSRLNAENTDSASHLWP